MKKTILVTGATGQVGGAVAKQLLANGFNVRAFTNTPIERSLPAQILKTLGAEVFEGNMEDIQSLSKAMKNVYGVFSVQPPSFPSNTATDEKEYYLGINVLETALENNIDHFVYSSVLGSERRSEYRPLFKYQIEERIHQSSIPATILKPSLFMETLFMPFHRISEGKLLNATPFHLPMPLIAKDDIGILARMAFQNQNEFLGKSINIGGDILTISEIASIISEVLKREITPVQLTLDDVKNQNVIYGKTMEEYYNKGYAQIDFKKLRELHPGLFTFKNWIKKNDKKLIQRLSNII